MGSLGEEEEKQGEVDEGAMTRATWRRGRIARRSSMTTWRKKHKDEDEANEGEHEEDFGGRRRRRLSRAPLGPIFGNLIGQDREAPL